MAGGKRGGEPGRTTTRVDRGGWRPHEWYIYDYQDGTYVLRHFRHPTRAAFRVPKSQHDRIVRGECPGCVTRDPGIAEVSGASRACLRCAILVARSKVARGEGLAAADPGLDLTAARGNH